MPNTFTTIKFNRLQLEWLKDMQGVVNRTLEEVEPDPAENPARANSSSEWQGHIVLQGRLESSAPDLNIPVAAVPNVIVCWNAQRNRFGLGMQFSIHCC